MISGQAQAASWARKCVERVETSSPMEFEIADRRTSSSRVSSKDTALFPTGSHLRLDWRWIRAMIEYLTLLSK